MKIYIYSLYNRKTGELLAKGTAKELARQHWYNSTDSVYQAYLTQKKRAGDLHGCSNCRIEREALEKPKKAPPKKAAPKKPEPPKHAKPYDWQADSAPSLVVDTSSKHTQDIADEISENLEKLVGSEPEPDVKVAPAKPAQTRMDSATIKFDNLKFGKNYDPTKES